MWIEQVWDWEFDLNPTFSVAGGTSNCGQDAGNVLSRWRRRLLVKVLSELIEAVFDDSAITNLTWRPWEQAEQHLRKTREAWEDARLEYWRGLYGWRVWIKAHSACFKLMHTPSPSKAKHYLLDYRVLNILKEALAGNSTRTFEGDVPIEPMRAFFSMMSLISVS